MAVYTKTVSLNPGEAKEITFTITPTVAKRYAVLVDNLSGSFDAYAKPAAQFEVSSLVISPSSVYIGETVTISVRVTNVGGVAGSYTVVCEVS